MERTSVGNVEVFALSDFVGKYVVAEKYPDSHQLMSEYQSLFDERGRAGMNFGCFLLRSEGQTILVDAGFGPEFNGRLFEELGEAGVGADDIDVLLFTHLHGDHTGWALDRETGAPLFTRARYLVPKADWDFFSAEEPQRPSFVKNIAGIAGSPQLELIEGELALTSALVTLPTPGHTPGHTAVSITSQGQQAYVIGDAFMSPMDVAMPDWTTTWDWNAEMVRETRRTLGERIEREQALVVSAHLPKPGLGHFVVTEGKRRWVGTGTSA